MSMTPRIKSVTAGNRELTVAAGLARGLMDLAVSKGADAAALAARSGIDPADLGDQDKRIALTKYVALMRAGRRWRTIRRWRCIMARAATCRNSRWWAFSPMPARPLPR